MNTEQHNRFCKAVRTGARALLVLYLLTMLGIALFSILGCNATPLTPVQQAQQRAKYQGHPERVGKVKVCRVFAQQQECSWVDRRELEKMLPPAGN